MAGYLGSVPVPQATQHRESFTCTEGQTSFATAGYTAQFVDVYLNGSHLSPADFTATNGSDVVLAVAASADDVCDIISYTPFEVADQTFTGTTTMDVAAITGSLNVDGTVTADGLTVDGSSLAVSFNGSAKVFMYLTEGDTTDLNTKIFQSGGSFGIQTLSDNLATSKSRFKIDHSTGDISFYEDAGSDVKLFWDASAESLGIGTSSPDNNLEIFTNSGDEGLTIKSTGDTSNAILMDANRGSAGAALAAIQGRWNGTSVADILFVAGADTTNKDDGAITFRTSSADNIAEKVRIDNAGNLLVGSTAAFVDGAVNSGGTQGICVATTSGNAGCLNLKLAGGNGTIARFIRGGQANGGVVGTISITTSATTYATSSDYRLKENVDYDWDATTRLKQLKPARFNFISDDTNTLVDGFLAHEAQAVVPEAVTGTKDAMMDEGYEVSAAVEEVTDEDGNVTTEAADAVMGTRSVPDMQGIDQSKLVPLLVKTIQELEARITALEG